MINRERPKSAVLERMGSSAAFARQLCAVASDDFRNIQPRARIWQLESWLYLNEGDKNIALMTVVMKTDMGSDYWQLRLNTVLSKEFQGENR